MTSLPKNPCYTTAPIVTSVGCDPCNASPIPTNNVSYSGGNLSCTQIKTCDSATVAFQKVETQICILKQQIAALQEIVNNCCSTTTTSTSSTSSTTTTTTTLPAGVYSFEMKYSEIGGTEACAEVTSNVYYSNTSTLSLFGGLTTDVGLTIPAPTGYYCLAAGCPNSSGAQWVFVGAYGQIVTIASC